VQRGWRWHPPGPWWRRALAVEPLFDRAVRWWRWRDGPTAADINRALVRGELRAGTSGLPIDEDEP
jgi:hypothetical protein